MRTGAEYREALRDGRKVWVMGGGAVDDVTTHPATRALVEEYAAWYDRHRDPEWRDVLLALPGDNGERAPWAFTVPRTKEDLIGMGRSFARTTFLSAGNITHDPAYGNLIALGILTTVQAQLTAKHPEFGGEIDTANPGADDCDRGVWHCRLLVLVIGARDRAPRQLQFARTVL